MSLPASKGTGSLMWPHSRFGNRPDRNSQVYLLCHSTTRRLYLNTRRAYRSSLLFLPSRLIPPCDMNPIYLPALRNPRSLSFLIPYTPLLSLSLSPKLFSSALTAWSFPILKILQDPIHISLLLYYLHFPAFVSIPSNQPNPNSATIIRSKKGYQRSLPSYTCWTLFDP